MKDTDSYFFAIARKTLKNQLSLIAAGKYKLLLPKKSYETGPSEGMPVHHVPELFIQLNGKSRLVFPGESITLTKGAICIVPPHSPHAEEVIGEPEKFLNLVVIAHDRMAYCHLGAPDANGVPYQKTAKSFHSTSRFDLAEILLEMPRYAGKSSISARSRTKGLLLVAFSQLFEQIQPDNSPDLNESIKIFKCRQLIAQYLDDPALSLPFIAQKILCSPDYLSYSFHQQTGIRFTNYVNNLRIEKATRLLTKSTETIYQIAASCGFTSSGYFIRLFKKSTGMTPKNYHTKHRQKTDASEDLP